MELRHSVDFWCDVALACVGWLYLAFAYTIVALRIAHVNLCPFALITGVQCPLCGTTRFIGTLLHGHLSAESIYLRGLAWFAVILSVAVMSSVRLVLGRMIPQGISPSRGL